MFPSRDSPRVRDDDPLRSRSFRVSASAQLRDESRDRRAKRVKRVMWIVAPAKVISNSIVVFPRDDFDIVNHSRGIKSLCPFILYCFTFPLFMLLVQYIIIQMLRYLGSRVCRYAIRYSYILAFSPAPRAHLTNLYPTLNVAASSISSHQASPRRVFFLLIEICLCSDLWRCLYTRRRLLYPSGCFRNATKPFVFPSEMSNSAREHCQIW